MDLDKNCYEYHPRFLGRKEADECLGSLWAGLEWVQKEITLFGRRVMQPRLIAWYGDPSIEYRYSGLSLCATDWHPLLLELRLQLESFTACRFNSVLANAYRSGKDSMGWHRDNEKELGRQPCIASMSLGAERRFLIRDTGGRSSAIVLEHGSLLLMKGECQQRYQHSLPKTRSQTGLRINLTYRRIIDRG